MSTRVSYPVEVKMKAIEMRLQGFPVKQVMEELNIRNRSQLKIWMKWYREGQLHLSRMVCQCCTRCLRKSFTDMPSTPWLPLFVSTLASADSIFSRDSISSIILRYNSLA